MLFFVASEKAQNQNTKRNEKSRNPRKGMIYFKFCTQKTKSTCQSRQLNQGQNCDANFENKREQRELNRNKMSSTKKLNSLKNVCFFSFH